MIKFNNISYKNFLSTGDQSTFIQLDKTITSIVVGSNGAGKSTFIDALVYALFGKPYRKVKLGQLINKVNEKGLEVEVNFSIGSKNYKVIRGQKPAKFEIYSDNVMIKQPATTADYQYILENDILKLNYKSFTQIIILGSASFVPFMQLKLSDRRDIIEDLLDISVFSKMNTILKSKIKETKGLLVSHQHDMDLTKEKHSSKREYLSESISALKGRVLSIEDQISETRNNISVCEDDILGHNERITELKNSMLECEGYEEKVLSATAKIESIKSDISEQQIRFDLLKSNGELEEDIKKKIDVANNEIDIINVSLQEATKKYDDVKIVIESYPNVSLERNKLKSEIAIFSNNLVSSKFKLDFYTNNDDCDECGQHIDDDFKKNTIEELTREIDNYNKCLKDNTDRLEVLDRDIKDKGVFIKDQMDLERLISTLNNDIEKYKGSISLMMDTIKTLDTEDPGAMGDLKHYISTLEKSYDDERNAIEFAKEKYNVFNDLDRKLNEVKKDLAISETQVYNYNNSLNTMIEEHLTLLHSPPCSVSQEDIDALGDKIKEIDSIIIKKKHLVHYYGIVQRLLKDDGLKTKIIKKFLPIINATINMYLDKFDFPINFEFDENFNETIQSKFRNDFSYYSFSEGEKSRIDLALLFTWRETALKKARNATNIIIFDEIFDGSLDVAGIENFMNILGLEEEGYNSFIISHKDETINSRFDRNLIFNKTGHFSKIQEK